MNIYQVLVATLSLIAFNCFAADPKFGLISGKGEILCVSFGEELPSVGTPITVINGESPQSSFAAMLGEKTADCKLLENAQVTSPYYAVITNRKFESPFVGIAVTGKHATIQKNGFVSLPASDAKEHIYFRICNSHEGLWFSSWYGRPLIGKQLWRQHFYLGYDVEPSCEEKDILEVKLKPT